MYFFENIFHKPSSKMFRKALSTTFLNYFKKNFLESIQWRRNFKLFENFYLKFLEIIYQKHILCRNFLPSKHFLVLVFLCFKKVLVSYLKILLHFFENLFHKLAFLKVFRKAFLKSFFNYPCFLKIFMYFIENLFFKLAF